MLGLIQVDAGCIRCVVGCVGDAVVCFRDSMLGKPSRLEPNHQNLDVPNSGTLII
jgi:hypothetical protein